jgi:hypothetical protein
MKPIHWPRHFYISGPMSGLPKFNFPAFMAAEKRLLALHHSNEVTNPAKLKMPANINHLSPRDRWRIYMRRDLVAMIQNNCCSMALLPGWRKSEGARAEVYVGSMLGLRIFDYPSMKQCSETILEEAQRLVQGDRGDDYGHPADDFAQTAMMVTGLLYHKLKDPINEPIRPAEVPRIMVCVKLSRQQTKPKRDNLVDGAGYFLTEDMVHQRDREGNVL